MPATMLQTHRVEKPWGRHTLYPGFEDVAPGSAPVGEVWFQEPGDTSPDLLIKYLFTSEKLSVQVHPDDEQAHARGLPRGGPVRQRFERHVRAWPLRRLGDALAAILSAEIECKRTGQPDQAIVRRLCLALSSSARAAKARR